MLGVGSWLFIPFALSLSKGPFAEEWFGRPTTNEFLMEEAARFLASNGGPRLASLYRTRCGGRSPK